VTLLALLGVNILAATLVRFRGKRHQLGFLVTHAGLLALLIGAIQTFLLGIEGQVVLQEGGRTDQFVDTSRSAITADWQASQGRTSTTFAFAPGPADWPKDRSLDFGTFNAASASFLSAVRELGPKRGTYPSRSVIGLEVRYNRWAPFRVAWICTLLAFLCLLLRMGTGWKSLYAAGWLAFAVALVAMATGFGLRVAISGRAPVTNMYESVVYLGLGVAVFGSVFELIFRRCFILTAAAAVATLALVLADNCPAALDPSLRPLQPVLRSNFWLVTHVMTITLSYAAFALALGLGNITLGYYFAKSEHEATISSLTNFTYRSLQVGVLLLAAGTILGGVWADYSWGRFWGWDPKEVWALITLLGYVAVLHARFAGWVRQFGLAVLSVLCFGLVVMAWYGVNFVLGVGLHSYGFSGGGQGYVFTALGVQFLYVVAAVVASGKWRWLATYDPLLPRVEPAVMVPSPGAAATTGK
jgi:cytochrome c-type biogenesis protein CcsB